MRSKRRNLRKKKPTYVISNRGSQRYVDVAMKLFDRHGEGWWDLHYILPMMHHAPIKRSVQKKK